MTWNTTGERDGLEEDGSHYDKKKVPELLAEQVEAADILLINKIDLAGPDQVEVASSVAKALNKDAPLYEVSFGKVDPAKILNLMGTELEINEVKVTDHSHSHEHASADDNIESKTNEHDHSHDHAKSDNVESKSHDHSHSHDHAASECADPECTDPTHDHSHSHSHASDCNDPTCTDPTHDHSHSHNHGIANEKHAQITNFVFKSDRPFNSKRLLSVLNSWPVPIKDDLDLTQYADAANDGIDYDGEIKKNPFVGVLRSKGYAWLAPISWSGPLSDAWRHNTAMFWSHAGKHFGINTAGSKSVEVFFSPNHCIVY